MPLLVTLIKHHNTQRNSKLAKTTQSILIHRHILKCFDTHKQNISTYTRLQLQNLQHSMLCFKLSITQCSTQLAKAMNRTELTLPNCLANQSIQTSSKQNRTSQPEAEPSTLEMKQQAAPLLSVNTLPTTL